MSSSVTLYEHETPDQIMECLEHGYSQTLAFNRRGTLLAVGTGDGQVAIWDFETSNLATALHRPVLDTDDAIQAKNKRLPIVAVSWSACGHYLVAATGDGTITRWDVLKGVPTIMCKLESARTAVIHPRRWNVCLAVPVGQEPVVVRILPSHQITPDIDTSTSTSTSETSSSTSDSTSMEVDTATSSSTQSTSTPSTSASTSTSTSTSTLNPGRTFHTLSLKNNPDVDLSKTKDQNIIAVFDPLGRYIYTGSSRGVITIWSAQSPHTHIYTIITPRSLAVKQIVFDRDGKWVLISTADRVLRVYDTTSHQFQREFRDVINNVQWRRCCFSGNAEYVVAASGDKSQHTMYIWSRTYGQLIGTYEGPKEGLLDLVYHPSRPIYVTCGNLGYTYVWGKTYTENWAAYAPDFEELEDNVEYVEREDEFDQLTGAQLQDRDDALLGPHHLNGKVMADSDDIIIDLMTCDKDEMALPPELPDAVIEDSHLDPYYGSELIHLPCIVTEDDETIYKFMARHARELVPQHVEHKEETKEENTKHVAAKNSKTSRTSSRNNKKSNKSHVKSEKSKSTTVSSPSPSPSASPSASTTSSRSSKKRSMSPSADSLDTKKIRIKMENA